MTVRSTRKPLPSRFLMYGSTASRRDIGCWGRGVGGDERSCDSTRTRGGIVGWRGAFPFEPQAVGFQLETAAVWPGRHEWRERHARQFREDAADLCHATGCGRASPCGFAVLSLELERRVGAEGERPGQDRIFGAEGAVDFALAEHRLQFSGHLDAEVKDAAVLAVQARHFDGHVEP